MSPEPDVLVEARSLALGYGGRVVLRDVDLAVRRGEFWFLVGRNGSGKSTFLHAVLGMLEPRAGTLSMTPALGGREHVGYVPQHGEMNPSLPTTVREFVSLGLVGLAVPRGERIARLRQALERVGLAELERAGFWSLSGGLRQRALVARALVREPLLLVLDEPMNHLDPDAEAALLADLVELNRRHGLTLLLVTHDVAMAERHATHVATFVDGTVRTQVRRAPAASASTPLEGRA
ncbi:MAG: ATP-binding cassette domain-containing protein [Thermodesulfobacteriota bacterium]